MYDRSEWWGFVRGNELPEFDGMPKLYEAPEGHKRKNFFLFFFLGLLPFYCRSFHGMMRADPRWWDVMYN